MIKYKTITKNYFSLTVTSLSVSLTNLITFAYLARTLRVTDFGTLKFAFSIIIIFELLAHMGIPKLGTREIARNRRDIKRYQNILNLIICTRLLLAALAFLILIPLVLFFSNSSKVSLVIIFYGLTLFPFALLINWFFEGTQEMNYIAYAQVLGSIAYILMIFLFIRAPEHLLIVPIFRTFYVLLIICTLFYFLHKKYPEIKLSFKFNMQSSFNFIKISGPMTAVKFKSKALFYINIIILGILAGQSYVGIYSAAWEIVFFLMIFPNIYSEVIYPVSSQYYKNSPDSLDRLFIFSFKALMLAVLPLSFFCIIRSNEIINIVYGSSYSSSPLTFRILTFAFIAVSFNVFLGALLLSCDRQIKYMWGILSTLLATLLLNMFTIRFLHSAGAALSILAAETLLFIYFYSEVRKFITIAFGRSMFKPALAVLLISLYIFITRNINIFYTAGSSVLIYLVLLKSLRIMDFRNIEEKLFHRLDNTLS